MLGDDCKYLNTVIPKHNISINYLAPLVFSFNVTFLNFMNVQTTKLSLFHHCFVWFYQMIMATMDTKSTVNVASKRIHLKLVSWTLMGGEMGVGLAWCETSQIGCLLPTLKLLFFIQSTNMVKFANTYHCYNCQK